jgi:LuxR family maltose regulon positive regulatory protein
LCNGNAAEAEKQFRQNLLLAQRHTLPIISLISRHGLGAIADLRNQLDQAEEHHLEVIRQPYLTTGRDAVVDMYSLIGIYARGGEPEKSRALVGELMESAQLAGKPFFLEQVAGLDAYTDLTCGKRKRALLWALGTPDREMSATFDRIPLIRARILLAEASEACLLKAEQILQELLRFYSNSHVWYRQTEILVLQALVQYGLGQTDSALTTLAEAVKLAVPKGGIGLFMGYGQALELLLQKLGTQPKLSHSVALLLTALATEDVTPKQDMSDHGLAQPLTERELSVLHLLAARYSNKEIARQLVVSPHTVRNHTANIYGKLQVSNRREAVQQAYAIGLLAASTDYKA